MAFVLTRWFPALSVVPRVRAECALVTTVKLLWRVSGATSLPPCRMPLLQAAGIEEQGANASRFEPYLEVKVKHCNRRRVRSGMARLPDAAPLCKRAELFLRKAGGSKRAL